MAISGSFSLIEYFFYRQSILKRIWHFMVCYRILVIIVFTSDISIYYWKKYKSLTIICTYMHIRCKHCIRDLLNIWRHSDEETCHGLYLRWASILSKKSELETVTVGVVVGVVNMGWEIHDNMRPHKRNIKCRFRESGRTSQKR